MLEYHPYKITYLLPSKSILRRCLSEKNSIQISEQTVIFPFFPKHSYLQSLSSHYLIKIIASLLQKVSDFK